MAKDHPRTLGNYDVEGELARGGMGVVLLGRQRGLERPAVLKKLRRQLSSEPELLERFRREARAAGAVHHQNVVAVYDCFSFRGDEYIAQEYVAGVDLCSALERVGRFPPRIASLVLLEVARGLEAIHAGGTVHRDLKPANILMGREGEVKIADFGIALESAADGLTRPGMMIGTPVYMPPEQMLGQRVDTRGDMFSLGVVFYEIMSGETPYREPGEDDAGTLLSQMQKEDFVPLRRRVRLAPRSLARLVRACLRAKPAKRPSSVTELRHRLERRLGSPSPPECRDEIASWLWARGVFKRRDDETVEKERPRPPRRLGPLALRAAAVLFVCGLVGSSVFLVRVRGVNLADHVPVAVQEFAERIGLGSGSER